MERAAQRRDRRNETAQSANAAADPVQSTEQAAEVLDLAAQLPELRGHCIDLAVERVEVDIDLVVQRCLITVDLLLSPS